MKKAADILAQTPLRIGLLLCDHVREHLQSEFGDYPDFFAKTIKRVAPDSVTTVYDITQQAFPEKIDEQNVYVISGSKTSCYEPVEWVEKLHDFVRRCHDQKQPMVGICFGHQLIARALGGEVKKSPKGWGVSVHTYIVENHNQLFDNQQILKILVSHQDQVIIPGDGGETIGSNDFCPNAIVVYGQHCITIQGHPEFTHKYSKRVLEIRKECIGIENYRQAQIDYNKTTDADTIAGSLLAYHLRSNS